MKRIFKRAWHILKDTKCNFQQSEPIIHSAAIAFFTIFSLPAILIFLSLLGSSFFAEARVRNEIIQNTEELISVQAAEQADEILQNMSNVPVGFWGILIAVVVLTNSATIIFYIIQKALNAVWRVKVRSDVKYTQLLKRRTVTLFMVAGLGFFFLSSILLDLLLNVFSEQLAAVFNEYISPALRTIHSVFNIILILVFFTTTHKILPDVKVAWKDACAGGVITSILFLIGKEIINYVLESIRIVGVYASAGSLVVLLLWVFYSALILLLGAEVTKAYAKSYNRIVEPTDIAVAYNRESED